MILQIYLVRLWWERRYLTNKIISSITINYYGEPCIVPSCACAPWKRPTQMDACWVLAILPSTKQTPFSSLQSQSSLSPWYKYKDKVFYIAALFATSGIVPSAITVFTFSAIQRQSVLHCRVVTTSGSGHKVASLKDHLSFMLYSLQSIASPTCDSWQSSISKLSIKPKCPGGSNEIPCMKCRHLWFELAP